MHKILKLAIALFLAIATLYPFIKPDDTIQTPPSDLPQPGDRPDFAGYTSSTEKKKAFFSYIGKAVAIENQRVSYERSNLLQMQKQLNTSGLSAKQRDYARSLGALYYEELPDKGVTKEWLVKILKKVNVLPPALALIQAANESAWGTSRFAVQANNYFGQWCYKKGCGLVPLQRVEGATHEVAKFDSVSASVNGYFMNVNRNKAYATLRGIREQLTRNGADLLSTDTALKLTNGLLKYSERGQDYVNDLQSMIRVNEKYWTTE